MKDTTHRSPLIRALAVRTMGCIRVDKITEYLCKPLALCMNDEDPYVKKTAAMCVAKLYDISPSMVREQGFLDQLRDLISDANPMVVANAVAALSEVQEVSERDVLEMTTTVLQKLLAALNECSEWGQVFILDFLAKFTPGDAVQAESIIERVLPRLAHSNSAVVLSAVKIVMRYLELITNEDSVNRFCRKLAPPLVTLSQSQQPEIQYVALRNINLVVQKRPTLLVHKIKVFFCKYNDPIYVKMEKLEILVRLASERNIDQLLQELKEYASEVDVDFVRKSVSTIGRCAIKLERAAERCIKVLLQLIKTEVDYVVQEAVVVIKNIFRKYPNRCVALLLGCAVSVVLDVDSSFLRVAVRRDVVARTQYMTGWLCTRVAASAATSPSSASCATRWTLWTSPRPRRAWYGSLASTPTASRTQTSCWKRSWRPSKTSRPPCSSSS